MVPLRVMHVVLSLSPGGTERLVIEMCRRLLPEIEPIVCCLDGPGAWASELTDAGISLYALERRRGFRPSLAIRIAMLAARHRVRVIHCHHYSPYVYGALATMFHRGIGLVYTEHGRLSDAAPSPKRRLVNPWLTRIPGQICAVSADLKRHMVAEGFPEHRVDVVYNGIAVDEPVGLTERAAARAQLNICSEAFVVGTVGRLDPVKNLSVLLRAHSQLIKDTPHAQLVIVGSGPEQQALQAEARALGAGDRVLFVGYRSDARRVMAAFDVYVNSSTYEGVSLAILEAMAAGLPVVATRVGGNPEVVLHDETGILVPGDAALPMAAAISALARDVPLRQQLGTAARARVLGRFSIDRMVDEYRRAYERTYSL